MCTGKQNVGNEGSKNDSPAKFCVFYIYFQSFRTKKLRKKIKANVMLWYESLYHSFTKEYGDKYVVILIRYSAIKIFSVRSLNSATIYLMAVYGLKYDII